MKVTAADNTNMKDYGDMPGGNFFSSPAWCSCYDARLKKFVITDDNNVVIGRFAAFEGGKGRLKTLITPPFSPHIGLCIIDHKQNPVKSNSLRKQVMEALAKFLLQSHYVYFKLDFGTDWYDMQPMQWNNIRTDVRYTYQLGLNTAISEIQSNFDSSKRNKINKATREQLNTSRTPDSSLALDMLREGLRDKPVALHEPILKNILAFAAVDNHAVWSVISSAENKLAINISIIADNCAVNLFNAINRKHNLHYAGTFCLFQSIRKSQELGLSTFDFEGSGVPEIEEYFRSFGGKLVPYYSVRGGKWPWPMIMKWKQKKGSAGKANPSDQS